jgi:hypothetical protein
MNIPGAPGFALNNPECLVVLYFHLFGGNSRDVGKRGELSVYTGHEGMDGVRRAFHLNNDPVRTVLNET